MNKPIKLLSLFLFIIMLILSIYFLSAFELSIKYSGNEELTNIKFYEWLDTYKYINIILTLLLIFQLILEISNQTFSIIYLILFFMLCSTCYNLFSIPYLISVYNKFDKISGFIEFKNINIIHIFISYGLISLQLIN